VCAGSLRSKCRLSTSLSALVCHVSAAQSNFPQKKERKHTQSKPHSLRTNNGFQNGTIRKQNGTKYKHQQEQQEQDDDDEQDGVAQSLIVFLGKLKIHKKKRACSG
jgi:hypothetical protein